MKKIVTKHKAISSKFDFKRIWSNLLLRYKKFAVFDTILTITVVLGIAFFIYAFFRKSDYVVATVKVGDNDVIFNDGVNWNGSRPWFTEFLNQGDIKQKDGLGRTVAEVLSIQSYDMRSNRKALYLKVRFKVVYDRASGQYVVNGLPLVIGATIRIPFSTVAVEGLITNIEGLPDIRKKTKLIIDAKMEWETSTYVGTSGIPPYLASEILKINEVKDGEGNVIIKVLQKRTEDADVFVPTADGRGFVSKNPLRKDVYLTLEVNAIEIGNRYFLFDDMPILIGDTIPLNTNKISVFAVVTQINRVEK